MKYLLLIYIMLLFFACTSEKRVEIKFVSLSQIDSVEVLNGSIYLSDVRSMSSNGDFLFVADYKSSQVYQLNPNNFDLLKMYSDYGTGPGESLGISSLYVSDSLLYIQDGKGKSIDVFGLYTDSISDNRLPSQIVGTSLDFDFYVKGSNVYLSAPLENSSISVFNKNGVLNTGGDFFDYQNPIKNHYWNFRNLITFKGSDLNFAISDSHPTIELIDNDLISVNNFNYSSELTFVQKSLEFINQKEQDDRGYYVLVEDVVAYSNNIYLLMYDYSGTVVTCNKIIKFDCNDKGGLTVTSVIELNENTFYSSIAVDSDFLYAFNVESSFLEKFKMN